MPFLAANISHIGNAARSPAAPQMHTYRTPDTVTEITTTGYFNAVAPALNVGDFIYVARIDGAGALLGAFTCCVRTKVGNVVDVVDQTALTVTNAG